MILAVDVGNTNIKVALFDGEGMPHLWRIESRAGRMRDEYIALLKSWLEPLVIGALDVVVIASVVAPVSQQLAPALEAITGLEPVMVTSQLALDLDLLRFGVGNYSQAGADLLVSAVAALALKNSLTKRSRLIVDMGSATTFNVVSLPKHFSGVAITAGPVATRNALIATAPAMPPVPLTAPASVLGYDTESAMQSGLVLGYASMVDGMIRRFATELGDDCSVIATGGLSHTIAPLCEHIDHLEPNLTLQGLAIFAKKMLETR